MSGPQDEPDFPCDPNDTSELLTLRQVPVEKRNADWVDQVLKHLPAAFLLGKQKEPFGGPDAFWYMALALPPEEGLQEGEQIFPMSVLGLMDYCLENGLGIVIFNDRSLNAEPFWVLNYGELQSLAMYKSLKGDPVDLQEMKDHPEKVNDGITQEEVKAEREILIGAPSEEFLPAKTRAILQYIFENHLGLPDVGVAVFSDLAFAPSRHLALSLQAMDFESQEQIQKAVFVLQWHLPPQRPIILNYGLEKDKFTPLRAV